MEIINLNKFKEAQKVKLDGVKYEVRTLNVNEFIDNDIQTRLEAHTEMKEQVKEMINIVGSYTTIPKDILIKQSFGVLNAIIMLIQGVDPETQEEETEKK
jgi:hypothetical protein